MPSPAVLIPLAGLCILALGSVALLRLAQMYRRSQLLQDLHRVADAQEATLRGLRQQLASANDDIRALTDAPVAEVNAHAFDAALREQLEHRLWLRDHAARAPLQELHTALVDWRAALQSLSQDAATLRAAHQELTAASTAETFQTR